MAAVVHGNAKETGMEKKINKISQKILRNGKLGTMFSTSNSTRYYFFFGCCRFRAVLFPR